jgi:soluble lytic murein transglycosylase
MLRTVQLMLGMVLLLLPVIGTAAIYTFVDGDGILHMSNVPNDPRYRLMLGQETRRPALSSSRYDVQIGVAARRYDLEPELIKAVVRAESGFNRLAVSSKGAMGLMQLMPATARELNLALPFDPGANIIAGSRYLRMMLDRFQGDLQLALAAYNAGPSRIEASHGMPAIAETRAYVKRVLQEYQRLRRHSGKAIDRGFLEAAR